jgi:hypothetical protein
VLHRKRFFIMQNPLSDLPKTNIQIGPVLAKPSGSTDRAS